MLAMSFKRLYLLVSVGLLCTACAAPVRHSQGLDHTLLPKTWHESLLGEGVVPSLDIEQAWLERLQAPALSTVIDSVLLHNKALSISQLQYAQAGLSVGISQADLWPQINVGFNVENTKALSDFDATRRTTSEQHTFKLNMRWQLDLWQVNRLQTKAAQLGFTQAAYWHTWQLYSLVNSASLQWFRLVSLYQQQQIAYEQMQHWQRFSTIVKSQWGRGLALSTDWHAAQTRLYEANALYEQLSDDITTQSNTLIALSGHTALSLPDLKTAVLPLPTSEPLQESVQSLLQRPDIKLSLLKVQQQDALTAAAFRKRLPSVTLVSDLAKRSPRFSDLDRSIFSTQSFVADILMPVFDAGRLRKSQRTQAINAEIAAQEFKQNLVNAFFEVKTSTDSEHYAREQLQALEQALLMAQETERRSLDSYKKGLGSINTLLLASTSRFDLQQRVIVIREAVLQARISRYLALGLPHSHEQKNNESI